jgi:4-alpha-glucanotransferase
MNLDEIAARFGIQSENHFIGGHKQKAPRETLERLLAAFGISENTAPPDASFELRAPEGAACHLPDGDARMWGIAVQLYQIRSERNWGIGDFADLVELARIAGAAGADFIGLNPLHALFLSNPWHCSPFSPSSRRFLNPLYIAVDRAPGFEEAGFEAGLVDPDALNNARSGDLVDYDAVARLKLPVLRSLWRQGPRDPAFDDFRAAGGTTLFRHALFEAISAHLTAQGHGAGWTSWPEEWHDVDGPTVRDFAERNPEAIEFHLWLQWLADRQLRDAGTACREAGMRIGLYLDFAVGEAPDGSGTWSDRELVVSGIHVGAPPDYFNEEGQNWGLSPLSPVVMAERRGAPFGDLVDDATRRAGALRIDHVMALWQLFLIPEGMPASSGTYVRYPLQDTLGALARASRERRTIIIGEDLGNVPDGFREVMAASNVLSYRILLFERTDDGFIPPDRYPQKALVCLSTHDLPTFQGWWRGDDVVLRRRHGLIGETAAADQSRARERERHELLEDLVRLDLMTEDAARAARPDEAGEDLVVAAHRLMARTPSLLFAARLEDLVGEREPVNLPSTTDQYPNWRRKLGISLEELPQTALFRNITAGIRAERARRESVE